MVLRMQFLKCEAEPGGNSVSRVAAGWNI
jgi:hypothetical protein